MRLLFCILLLLLPLASAATQEKKLDPIEPRPTLSELGGSTDKATLVLNPIGHVGPIQGVFFTRDNKQLITVGVDATVQFWDIVNGERVRVLRLPFAPTAVALAPDGKTLAVGKTFGQKQKNNPQKIGLVNLDDGRVYPLRGRNDNIPGRFTVFAFSHDGDQLAASHQGGGVPINSLWQGLKGVWDKTPEQAVQIRPRSFTPDRIREMFDVLSLAFSPDGKRVAIGKGASGDTPGQKTAYIAEIPAIDVKPEKPLALDSPPRANVLAVTWTSDGQRVVTVDQNSGPSSAVKIWSVTGDLLQQYELGSRDGSGLHVLNDKQLLLTWYNDGSAKEIGPRGHGQSVLTLGDSITERKGPQLPGGDYAHAGQAALSSDGKLAVLTGGRHQNEILIWNVVSGDVRHHLGKQLTTARSVGWSKDGKHLGLDAYEEKEKPLFRYALNFVEMQLAQQVDRGDYLYKHKTNGDYQVRVQKGVLQLWHGDKVVAQPGHSRIGIVAPGKTPPWWAYTLGYHGGTLHLNDVVTGKPFVPFLRPNPLRVHDIAPAPDGRFLVAVNEMQVALIYHIPADPTNTDRDPVLYLYVSQGDWIMWTKEGYYAANPGGERLMGWTVEVDRHQLPTFHPADRFRKRLYRPDIIKRIFETGNVAEAVKAADKALGIETRDINVDRLLPPRATLTVIDKSKLPFVKVKVQAEATSNDQPIMALRLIVDGRVVPGNETLAEFAKGKDKVELEWTVELSDGEHQLAVLARGRDSSSISQPVYVKGINPVKLPALHVLAIGINSYNDNTLDLKFAAPDAKAIAAAFDQHCKPQPFRNVHAHMLVDRQATKQEILYKLAEIRRATQQQDLVVVFFACHGVKHGPEYYLLTHEAKVKDLAGSTLSGADLRKHLGEFKCQVFLMLDACHAADFGAGKKLAKLGMRPATDDAARDLTDNEVGIAVMCAAMGHEKAEGNAGHGLFTQAVLEVLEKKPGMPVRFNRHDQRVYVHHLHSYVFDEVSDRSKNRQHPFLSLPWVVESFVVR